SVAASSTWEPSGSVALTLPSSPHWAPTTTIAGMWITASEAVLVTAGRLRLSPGAGDSGRGPTRVYRNAPPVDGVHRSPEQASRLGGRGSAERVDIRRVGPPVA